MWRIVASGNFLFRWISKSAAKSPKRVGLSRLPSGRPLRIGTVWWGAMSGCKMCTRHIMNKLIRFNLAFIEICSFGAFSTKLFRGTIKFCSDVFLIKVSIGTCVPVYCRRSICTWTSKGNWYFVPYGNKFSKSNTHFSVDGRTYYSRLVIHLSSFGDTVQIQQ